MYDGRLQKYAFLTQKHISGTLVSVPRSYFRGRNSVPCLDAPLLMKQRENKGTCPPRNYASFLDYIPGRSRIIEFLALRARTCFQVNPPRPSPICIPHNPRFKQTKVAIYKGGDVEGCGRILQLVGEYLYRHTCKYSHSCLRTRRRDTPGEPTARPQGLALPYSYVPTRNCKESENSKFKLDQPHH